MLWALDNELNQIFPAAVKAGTTNNRRQGEWRRVSRDGCGADEACLVGVYNARIKVLR